MDFAQETKHGFQELFADRKHIYAAVLMSHWYHYLGIFATNNIATINIQLTVLKEILNLNLQSCFQT